MNKSNSGKHRFKFLPLSFGIAGVVALSNPASTLAADEVTGLPGEDLFFSEIPIVLSATRLSQPVTDIPAAITVIDREMIDATGAVNIADLFRLVPGFQVGFFTGAKPSVSYHGKSDRYARDMQVLVDGRSIYDPAFGGVTWLDQEIDIDDIQRIEVVRGPNAASYGSNSFAGVINIVTYNTNQQHGVRLKTILGKFDHRQVTARYAGSAGDLSYRLTTKYDQDDGFKTRISDDSNTRWLSFRGDYNASPTDSFILQLGASNGEREDGFVADAIQPPRSAEDKHHFQQLRWTHHLGEGDEFYLQAYHNYQRIDDDFLNLFDADTGIPADTFHLGYGFQSHRYDLEFQHNLSLSEDLRLVWGLGARRDQATGIWTFNTEDWLSRDQARAFANMEWKPTDKITVNMGGMYEKFEEKSGFFSPRIALNFKPTQNHAFRLISTEAYRMPTLFEDFSDLNARAVVAFPISTIQFYKNIVNVKPEKIRALEAGYLLNLPKYDFQLDIKAYKESISNLISEIRDNTAAACGVTVCPFYYDNEGHFDVWGWELGLDWKPTPASMIHFAYSKAKAGGEYNKYFPATPTGVKYLADYVQEQTFSVLGSYRFDSGFKLSGGFYYMDPVIWGGDGDVVYNNHRTDIYLSKEFKQSDISGEVGLLVQRYSDDYWDFYKDPDDNQVNRWADRVFLQLSLNWY